MKKLIIGVVRAQITITRKGSINPLQLRKAGRSYLTSANHYKQTKPSEGFTHFFFLNINISMPVVRTVRNNS